MSDDLRPYAGKLVRIVEADRTVAGFLDCLVDKHRQPVPDAAVVRNAVIQGGDVVVEASHVEDIEVIDERTDWRQRAENAEAAIARVRRLCELTIAASCRVQAIEQARDTLAVLDGQEADRG